MKVRFAPSPTGPLHIGGARTALFNYVFAKKENAKFVLRIDDTDAERNQETFVDDIKSNLKWLGMQWDEEYRQSERGEIYAEMAKKLEDEGKAYRNEGALYLKVDTSAEIVFDDLIRGRVVFPGDSQKDFVILRSDNSPLYHFTSVVDDALLGITHIIRGEDHLSNTPKHIHLFKALGFEPPVLAHLPLIHNIEGGKMSKRSGDTAVTEYRLNGYLPEALNNFLLLLGWMPTGGEEFVTLEKAISQFEVSDIKKSPAAFDIKKLNHINHHYLQQLDIHEYFDAAESFMQDWPDSVDWRKLALEIVRDRAEYLAQLDGMVRFAFAMPEYPAEILIFKKSDQAKSLQGLKAALEALQANNDWTRDGVQKALEEAKEKEGLQPGDIFWPVRVAMTGLEASPPPQDVTAMLTKEEAIARLQKAISRLMDE